MHDYGHTVMVGSCAIDPNWSNTNMLKLEPISPEEIQLAIDNGNKWQEQYNEDMKDSNIQPKYNVAHTCGVDYRWFPPSFPSPAKGAEFLPDQPPQSSETMITVDEATRTQYKGNKPLGSTYNWQQWGGEDPNKINLSYKEQQILMYTKLTWEQFMALENKSQDDIIEFKDAIHRLQQLIALRVARRVDTAVWLQP